MAPYEEKPEPAGEIPSLPIKMEPDALEEDCSTSDSKTIPVFLLKVSTRNPEVSKSRVQGLILQQKNDAEYSRLGVFELDNNYTFTHTNKGREGQSRTYQTHSDWFDSCGPQIVTIV